MTKIIISAFLLLFSCNVLAAELWQGLDSGAYTQQVIKKFPTAKRDSNRDIPKEFDNRLVMRNYIIFDQPFNVYFLMKDNKLREVLLNTELDDPSLLWSDAFDALVLNYGAPSYNASEYGISMADWYYNGIEVSLLSDTTNLFISYSTNIVDNAKKL